MVVGQTVGIRANTYTHAPTHSRSEQRLGACRLVAIGSGGDGGVEKEVMVELLWGNTTRDEHMLGPSRRDSYGKICLI